jgi:hypothetical protein
MTSRDLRLFTVVLLDDAMPDESPGGPSANAASPVEDW